MCCRCRILTELKIVSLLGDDKSWHSASVEAKIGISLFSAEEGAPRDFGTHVVLWGNQSELLPLLLCAFILKHSHVLSPQRLALTSVPSHTTPVWTWLELMWDVGGFPGLGPLGGKRQVVVASQGTQRPCGGLRAWDWRGRQECFLAQNRTSNPRRHGCRCCWFTLTVRSAANSVFTRFHHSRRQHRSHDI